MPNAEYLAPELMSYDDVPLFDDFSKVDVWSLGIILLTMITPEIPFQSFNDKDEFNRFIDNPINFLKRPQIKLEDE